MHRKPRALRVDTDGHAAVRAIHRPPGGGSSAGPVEEGAGVNTAKVTSCGSRSTAHRPTVGASCGSTLTRAPRLLACCTVAFTSGVETYESQCGRAPSRRSLSAKGRSAPKNAFPFAHMRYVASSSQDLIPQPITFL